MIETRKNALNCAVTLQKCCRIYSVARCSIPCCYHIQSQLFISQVYTLHLKHFKNIFWRQFRKLIGTYGNFWKKYFQLVYVSTCIRNATQEPCKEQCSFNIDTVRSQCITSLKYWRWWWWLWVVVLPLFVYFDDWHCSLPPLPLRIIFPPHINSNIPDIQPPTSLHRQAHILLTSVLIPQTLSDSIVTLRDTM